jgi:hypothetical protein
VAQQIARTMGDDILEAANLDAGSFVPGEHRPLGLRR